MQIGNTSRGFYVRILAAWLKPFRKRRIFPIPANADGVAPAAGL